MALQKREKNLLIVLGVITVISAIILYLVYRPQEIETVEGDDTTIETPARTPSRSTGGGSRGGGGGAPSAGNSTSSASSISAITFDQFKTHNNLNSCWVLIDGKVYDITSYLGKIPNAEEIGPYCGTLGFEEGFLEEATSVKDSVIQNATLKGTIG